MARDKNAWGTTVGTVAATVDEILMDADRPLSIAEIREEILRREGKPYGGLGPHLARMQRKPYVDGLPRGPFIEKLPDDRYRRLAGTRSPTPALTEDAWSEVWEKLRAALADLPRCEEHPDLPAVRTLRDGSVNDLLTVDLDGIAVRSHQTMREDVIPQATFRVWWERLVADGAAAVRPGQAPRADRAVLVAAILARCLPDRIADDGDRIVYIPPADGPPPTPRRLRETFEDDVRQSGGLSLEELKTRLAAAPAKPERFRVVSTEFRRNPDVVAFVLKRADGVCEQCGEPAPFNRVSDGSPYLEVHHVVPLAEGGDDTAENARAPCPNCHRDAHHGPASVR